MRRAGRAPGELVSRAAAAGSGAPRFGEGTVGPFGVLGAFTLWVSVGLVEDIEFEAGFMGYMDASRLPRTTWARWNGQVASFIFGPWCGRTPAGSHRASIDLAQPLRRPLLSSRWLMDLRARRCDPTRVTRALAHHRSRRFRRKAGAGLAPRADAVVDFRRQQAGQGDVDLLRWAEIPFHRRFDHRPNPAGEVWIGSVSMDVGRTLDSSRRPAGFLQFLDQIRIAHDS